MAALAARGPFRARNQRCLRALEINNKEINNNKLSAVSELPPVYYYRTEFIYLFIYYSGTAYAERRP